VIRYHIGLLMINGENDVLERTLAHNSEYVDAFYVLDGTVPNDESERICRAHPKCWGYRTDAQLPRPPYGDKPVCGWRQFMLEHAYADHGHDNWFLILHGDEVWTKHPKEMVTSSFDGYIYKLPFYFPREGEEWDPAVHPLDQLHWSLWPGYPEFRLFLGGEGVNFNRDQRFNTRPAGIKRAAIAPDPILHYLYRSPDAQRARAAEHARTDFDLANYLHILDDDAVYWTDEMIGRYRRKEFFTELRDTAQVGV
jgi:hypothetical protein